MKKKQKINKAVNLGELLLLGLTALFLCVLFFLRERPAPARAITVRTLSSGAPDSIADPAPASDNASASNADAAPDDAAAPASDNASASDAPDNAAPDDGRINLNTADVAELCALPGVGEALAKRIVDYREEHGDFARPEDVMRVSGIGEGKFSAMKNLITV